ncbi:MAG: DUF4340 domain-containing protein [Saprospirales bacterium]|nr:MAG: DUF4340 domain-containing protein [Saprospirales bacterium]
MKRTILYIIVLLALLGLTYHFAGQESRGGSSIDTSDREFAIKDTDQIGKIFIANRNDEPVLLNRRGSDWYVNDRYLASKTSMEELMRIIRDLEVRFIPPRASYTNIVQTIASLGIKVEIYDTRDNLMKSYYIGGVTNDEKGTHFLMEGSEQPYVMHIPYWSGSLRARFDLRADHFRDRAIFNERIRDIEKIEVKYPFQQDESFVIEREGETSWGVRPLDPDMPRITRTRHPGLVESYLRNYRRVGVEGFENQHPQKDSILSSDPFAKISLTRNNGDVVSYTLYQRFPELIPGPFAAAEFDATEFQLRFYVHSAQRDDFMLAQYFVLRDILWGYSWFFRTTEDEFF